MVKDPLELLSQLSKLSWISKKTKERKKKNMERGRNSTRRGPFTIGRVLKFCPYFRYFSCNVAAAAAAGFNDDDGEQE